MILKSFGCSFIFGTDLTDASYHGLTAGSQMTWPALLAADLDYKYQTHSRPGSGNLRILETVLQQSTEVESSVFVIGWTWIDRFDYTVAPTVEFNHWDFVGSNQWKTIMPVDRDLLAQTYYRDLHSQFRDKLTTLIYIKTAIDTLKQKHIPFVMTYMDDLIFETQWHITPAILDLQDYIRPYITTFEGQTFLEFSKEKGFPISETLHPLEDAHQAAFELIKSYNLV